MKKEEKRQKIIEKSLEFFREKGYTEVRVEEITKELGISKGSFYTYFKSKEEVMVEVLKILKKEYIKNLENIVITGDAKSILESYINLKLKLFVKNFYKINFENMSKILKITCTDKIVEEMSIITKKFIIENIVRKYENKNYNEDFIANFIKETIDEHFWNEMMNNKIGDRQTYIERKKENIKQMVNFIHNGLKR